MACSIVFNGNSYTEDQFREFIRQGLYLDELAHKEVSPVIQARFEMLGVSPDTMKQYKPIAINKANKVLNQIKDLLIDGKDENKELLLDILKVSGLITQKKYNNQYWVKSDLPESDRLTTNKKESGAQLNQPLFFINASTLSFIKEAYPNLLKLTFSESKKGAYITTTTDFTSAALKKSNSQPMDLNIPIEEEEIPGATTTTSTKSKYSKASKQITKDLTIRKNRLAELIAKNVGNKYVHEAKIKEIEEDLAQITQAEDDLLPLLYQQANRDILGVQKLLENNQYINQSEIHEAMITLGVWQNLPEILDQIHLDDTLQKIVNDSTKLRKLLSEVSKQLFKEEGKKIDLKIQDMELMKDDSSWKALTIDISSSVNPFLQHIFRFTNAAALERDEEIRHKTEELGKLSKGLTPNDINQLYQRDKNGNVLYNSLVNRLSDKWWDALKYRSALSKKSKSVNSKKKIREFLQQNQVILDPQIFIRDGAGNLVASDAQRQSIINQFAKDLGDAEYAQELVEQGQRKYDRYKQDEAKYEEYLEIKYSGDVNKNEIIANSMREFRGKNDPNVYYTYYYAPAFRQDLHDLYGKYVNPAYNKFLMTAPRKYINGVETGWHDKQFEAMKQNARLYELYKFINETTKQGKKHLPSYTLQDDQSNYVYRAKSTAADILRSDGTLAFLKKVGNNVTSWFAQEYDDATVNQVDPDTGKPIRSIPISKLTNIDKRIDKLEYTLDNVDKLNLTPLEIENMRNELNNLKTSYSKDLIASMEVFITMTSNYKYMSQVHDKALLAQGIVNKAKELGDQGPQEGLENSKKALDYYIDSMLYGRHKDIEGQRKKGKWNDSIFTALDLVPLGLLGQSKQKQRANEIAKVLKESEQEVQDLIDKKSRGEEMSITENQKIQDFYNLDREYQSLGGKRTTWSAIADSLIKFTQFKALGFAPMSSISNMTFGVISNYIHAAGREDFTEKEMNRAWGIMLNSTKNYLTFGKGNNAISDKVKGLMEKLNVITEILPARYGELNKKKSKIDPYMWFRSTDFFIKGQTAVASLIHTKVPGINGEISLWDALDDTGELDKTKVTPEFFEQWHNGGRVEQAQKLIKITKIIHGVGDNNSPVLAKKTAIGRLISQFRLSWMAEGIEARFAQKYHNTTLGRDLEGRYVTTWHLAQDFSQSFSNGVGNPIQRFQQAMTIMGQRELTPLEKANLRKTMADMVLLAAMMGMMVLIKGIYAGDDDKIDSKKASWIFNMVYRTEQDVQFFMSPEVFTTFTQQVIPAMSVYKDFKKAFVTSADYIMEDPDVDGSDVAKYWAKAFPISRQIYNFKNYTEKDLSKLQIK